MPQPRVPTHLKKLRATYRAPKKGEGVAAGEALKTAPKHLTERQRGIWKSALEAAPEGVLLRIDRDLLAAWVVNVDRQREANRQMQTTGDPDDLARCHKIVTDTSRLLVVLSQALGFSPASRLRIKPETRLKKDEPDSVWSMLRLVPKDDPQKIC
jgi:phage terminase small subunit